MDLQQKLIKENKESKNKASRLRYSWSLAFIMKESEVENFGENK